MRLSGGLVNQRIDKDAVWKTAYDPPFLLPGHGIDVAPSQEAPVVGVLKSIQIRWVNPELAVVKLNGALVLFAALYEHLLFVPLRFKHHAGHLHIEGNGYHGRQQKHKKHGKTALPVLFVSVTHHPAWGSSGKVCSALNSKSSTTTEFTPMRTTRYLFFNMSPSEPTSI